MRNETRAVLAGLGSRFTAEQRDVIDGKPSNTVVFASPGSGKTTTLNEHILRQLTSRVFRPSEMMAVTFTRQAALDLKHRLTMRVPERAKMIEAIRVGTFHAQVFRMLLPFIPGPPVVLSATEQLIMMKTAITNTGLVSGNHEREWLSRVTKYKSVWPSIGLKGIEKRVLTGYERLKAKAGRWDYDDILLRFCELIHSEAADLNLLPCVRYILVDEFQDTNQVQWEIVKRLSLIWNCPIFVVGDDDQSIYGFRGANPKWLIHFCKHIPDAKTCLLQENFRSDIKIVQHAETLVRKNVLRQVKNMRINSTFDGVCCIRTWKNEHYESSGVANLVRCQLECTPDATVAVLARTRTQLQHIWLAIGTRWGKAVQFRTFHDAKGKEWDCVHIAGAVSSNPYLIAGPYSRLMQGDLEEERRLFYVAMTRARHELYIHAPLSVNGKKTSPIQFIEESGLTL